MNFLKVHVGTCTEFKASYCDGQAGIDEGKPLGRRTRRACSVRKEPIAALPFPYDRAFAGVRPISRKRSIPSCIGKVFCVPSRSRSDTVSSRWSRAPTVIKTGIRCSRASTIFRSSRSGLSSNTDLNPASSSRVHHALSIARARIRHRCDRRPDRAQATRAANLHDAQEASR